MTDERDVRDPALDDAWRAQSTETPPPALDAAILAAAHRAVKSAPEKIGPGREATRPWRWWTPLAAAAVIGAIAIGALELLPQEPDVTKAVVSDAPPATTAKRAAEATTPASASAAREERAAAPAAPAPAPAPAAAAPLRQRKASPPAAAPSTPSADAATRPPKVLDGPRPAPEPFPARRDSEAAVTSESDAASRSTGNVVAPSSRAQAAPAQQGAPAAAGAAAPAPALAKRAMRDEISAQRTPDDFVARIRKLFSEGSVDEAQRELVAFRAAYADADARLPADLRPWAATLPRH